LITCAAVSTRAQQDPEQEDVRGAFLSTRVTVAAGSGSTGSSSTGRSTRSSRRPTSTRSSSKGTTTARSTGKVGTGTKSTAVKSNNGGGSNTSSGGNIPVNAYAGKPIGLGYSLYMRDANGDPVRVDPTRTFRAGDRIRISLESNTDGYLYVFHTENNGEPQMLYPNARLDEGDNFVEAHVPYELPWSGEAPENRWFVFDNNPANERLYIVLSREPLPAVPTGEQLIAYCRDKGSACMWRPASNLWSQVRVNAEGKVIVDSKAATYGQKQTESERDATTRGLGLAPASPEPSVVRMNASSNAGVLVTALDLIHQ
ncbi:MAG TPA: DUF4384 domain-containing protein, partial [Pyrinomonadaceae bacterium]|nr:DUF4384 domain-containing protein [Pyrinomonadaceae bacterium]